ncbi:MAG: hypothetical protein P9M13_00780 [Candidatus Ancaeobacter aquaticus]|nr:hypothetical protein [Candidatus Ancaeobacter aquaticus]
MRSRFNILIIFVLSLVPLMWFREGLLIAGGDGPLFLNPVNYFQNFVRYPVSDISGVHAFEVNLIFPLLIFYYIFEAAGVSLIVTEKTLFVLYFFVAGTSMYYLMTVLLKSDKKYDNFAKLIAAVFYMFNYFVILVNPLLTQFIAYTLMPLILGLYIKGTTTDGPPLFKRSLLFVAALSFLPAAFSNPPFIVVIICILVGYSLFDLIIVNRFKNISRILSFILLSIFLYILINLWFLGVWYVHFTSSGNAIANILPGYWNPGSDLSQTFVLKGSWAWNDQYFPYFYEYFEKTPFKIFAYLFPITIFTILLFKIKKFIMYFFILLAFAGIFFAKGRWGMFGGIYAYLFDNCPIFLMFREPHAKFTLLTVLGYSVLLGVSLSKIIQYIVYRMRKIGFLHRFKNTVFCGIGTFVIFMIVYNSWPIVTGNIISDKRGQIPSFRVKVPNYWLEAADWFNNQDEDFNILELPENKWPSIWLAWDQGYAAGGNPVNFLFNKSTIHSPVSNVIARQVYTGLTQGMSSNIYKLLQMLNVKYLFQRNDYLWNTLKTDSPSDVKKMLSNQKNIKLEKTFDKLDIYSINTKPSVFTSTEYLAGVFGGTKSLIPLSVFYDVDRMGFYFFKHLKDDDINALNSFSSLIVFNNSFDDLVKDFVPDKYRLDPVNALTWKDTDIKKGWAIANDMNKTPFNLTERKLLVGEYLNKGKGVLTMSKKPLSFNYFADKKGVYSIFIRMMPLSSGEGLSFFIDGRKIRMFKNIESERTFFQWKEVGECNLSQGDHIVTINSNGTRYLVDEIIVIPERNIEIEEDKLLEVIKENKSSIDYLFYTEKCYNNQNLYIPQDGSCRLDVVLSKNDLNMNKAIYVDKVLIDLNQDSNDKLFANIKLRKGKHTIKTDIKGGIVKVSQKSQFDDTVGPIINYEKYGSSRYKVEINNISKPFYLIFKNNFDVNWKLSRLIDNNKDYVLKKFDLFSIFRKRSNMEEIGKHSVVNGYANAYYIDDNGDNIYILENKMHRVFENSVLISLLSVCLIIVIFGLKRFK